MDNNTCKRVAIMELKKMQRGLFGLPLRVRILRIYARGRFKQPRNFFVLNKFLRICISAIGV